MKFFVPQAPDDAQAEYFWQGMRLVLADRGMPTEPRRIHSLFFRAAGEPRVLQVGVEDSETLEPVVTIYRAADAPFYWVVTPAYGIIEGAPMPVAVAGTRAVDFGPARPDPSRRRKRRRP